jgi:peptidoglycan/LPS O-acetylase OafA/YrhL
MSGRIAPRLSTALDGLRAFAATYVVFHHIFEAWGIQTGIGILFLFGQEAVIVFFLLSGFVIMASESGRVASDLAGYALRRLIRIYPLLLLSLLVSTLVALANQRLAGSFSWSGLAGTAFALQDDIVRKPGAIVSPYLGNSPLWSLSYEIWFYALFPVVCALIRRMGYSQWLVSGISLIAFFLYLWIPNFACLILIYFPIWWLGAGLAYSLANGTTTVRTTLILQASIAGIAALGVSYAELVKPSPQMAGFLWLMARHFLAALVLFQGLAALVHRKWSHDQTAFAFPLSYAASLSYGLYVLHFPLLIDSGIYASWPGLLGGFMLLLALCWLFDRQLSLWLRRRLQAVQAPASET